MKEKIVLVIEDLDNYELVLVKLSDLFEKIILHYTDTNWTRAVDFVLRCKGFFEVIYKGVINAGGKE